MIPELQDPNSPIYLKAIVAGLLGVVEGYEIALGISKEKQGEFTSEIVREAEKWLKGEE